MTDIGDVKAYWDKRPCNIRHSPALVGSERYFDEVEQRKYYVERHIPAFADFPKWEGKKVLEVGCGIGTDTMNFARRGAQVTAVDISPGSLAIAEQRAHVLGLDIRFFEADAENLSSYIPVEEYDLVYSFGALHHTPNPERAFTAIREFLAPSGQLRTMVYHRYSTKAIALTRGMLWRNDLIARQSEAQSGCPVTFAYGRNSFKALLERAGFDVEDIRVDHIFPYQTEAYKRYEYKVKSQYAWMPLELFQFLERHFGWHLLAIASPK